MWTFECADETSASPSAVWALWSDPARWPEFNPAIEWVKIDGPFAAGTQGKLKPHRGRATPIQIVAVEPERQFVSSGKLPFSKLRFEHELSEGNGGRTRIVHRIQISGPFGKRFGKSLKMDQNEVAVVANLARIAAAEDAARAGA